MSYFPVAHRSAFGNGVHGDLRAFESSAKSLPEIVRKWSRLPDQLSVIAGPFSGWQIPFMAFRRHSSRSRIVPTKRLSKHSLLKQRRAGYRPPALTRILDQRNGPQERSVETFNSGEKAQDRSKSMRGGGKEGSAARPPTDRRHRRPKGEREAIRDRPSTRLGKAKKPATLHGQSVAGYCRDRRAFDGRGTRTSRPLLRVTPPVAAKTIVEPATLAHTTQVPRPVRPRSGTTPRLFAVDECVFTLDSLCVRAEGTKNNNERHLPASVDITSTLRKQVVNVSVNVSKLQTVRPARETI